MTTTDAIGIDIGGTKLAAGVVALDGTVKARARRDTPASQPETIVDVVADLVAELSDGAGPLPVGVGAAGIIDLDGTVRYSPNIDWVTYPLREELVERLATTVTVDNDANAAAWAEHRAGAASQAWANMVLLTVGTGVGGGLVLDDCLVRGTQGLAAEFGHMVVDEGGPRCSCGNRGCLEAVASGTAIGRMAREEALVHQVPRESPLAEIAQEELTGKAVTRAAHSGDAFADAILQRAGFWLGVGIASLVNALDPEVVVVGGGAIEAGEHLLGPARASYVERLMGRPHRPEVPVLAAQFGDDAGLVGAALRAGELSEEVRATGTAERTAPGSG